MQLLFPAQPFQPSVPDEAYAQEFEALRAQGVACSLFSLEDFEAGAFKPRPALVPEVPVMYRGWMLTPEKYAQLHEAIAKKGATPLTSPAQYTACHHLPLWYALCTDLTPETIVVPQDADFAAILANTMWPAYFVKDYVKSLGTQHGSIAQTPEEITTIVEQMEHYRGSIEGGICIRQWESLHPDSEERYFVLHGQAYARDGHVPAIVHDVAARIACPFFSVDIATATNGTLRLIELGDGQVSDRKLWPITAFISMLCQA